jgi:hypothetical protein
MLSVMRQNPDRPWQGRWQLVAHTGFKEWLIHRGVSPADADAEVQTLLHRTVLSISSKKSGVRFVWSTDVPKRFFDARRKVDYSLDGTTATVVGSPIGETSAVATLDGAELVHHVSGSSHRETHRRRVVGDRMILEMTVDGSTKNAGTWCELEWLRL